MSDEKPPAERLSKLEERMGRLEVRMDAVVKQIESLRKDLDDHFDGVNQRLDLLYLGIDSIADILRERLPIPENPET